MTELIKLLTPWQRWRVRRRPVITSCDLNYSGHVKHLAGTCEPHGAREENR